LTIEAHDRRRPDRQQPEYTMPATLNFRSDAPAVARKRSGSGILAAFCLLAAAAFAVPAPAAAEDEAAVIATCLGAARVANKDGRDCIGKISDPCLEGGGAATTASMVACIDREVKIWDSLLNADYQTLLKAVAPPAAESIRQAQRAWIASRDADCKVPYDIYEGGTIASIDGASCMLSHTGERVLQLRAWHDMARPEEN
jgi:uncharacterized protein YecT (DUF1311 family)